MPMTRRVDARVGDYTNLKAAFSPSNATWSYTDPVDMQQFNALYLMVYRDTAQAAKTARICVQWGPTSSGPWIDETKAKSPTESGNEYQSDILIDVRNLSMTTGDPEICMPYNRGNRWFRVGYRSNDVTTGKIVIDYLLGNE